MPQNKPARGDEAIACFASHVINEGPAASNHTSARADFSAPQTTSLPTQIEGLNEMSQNSKGSVLIRWSVEPPKGTGMVKVLLQVSWLRTIINLLRNIDFLHLIFV